MFRQIITECTVISTEILPQMIITLVCGLFVVDGDVAVFCRALKPQLAPQLSFQRCRDHEKLAWSLFCKVGFNESGEYVSL